MVQIEKADYLKKIILIISLQTKKTLSLDYKLMKNFALKSNLYLLSMNVDIFPNSLIDSFKQEVMWVTFR